MTARKPPPQSSSVFANFDESAYPHRFSGTLLVGTLVGGTPTDPKVAEGWLRSKLEKKDDIIRDLVAEVMVQRGVDAEAATEEVNRNRHLNGFRRDESGLFIEGRQLKAAIKEAANVRWAGDRWGPTRKGTTAFFAEHVFVTEQRLHLGITEPSGVMQRFVHSWHGSAIQYDEYVEDAKIDFTVVADFAFTDKQWALLWLTGQRQGIGASRSQGYGCYEVVRWELAP